ncbi:hypothetical protein KA529_04290 [Candidatus Saccharibacteria bacterium]|jgi:SOS-response transcriptional repressor LexA|nr:hypothetical protein [Candidatus Saccharibacteria bacterium]
MPNPTKKQRELLNYIAQFISEHGYAPSYREIKRALSYSAVSTVAAHVQNLTTLGYLRKRDRSARSLEVTNLETDSEYSVDTVKPAAEKWLVDQVDAQFSFVENNPKRSQDQIDQLYVLVGALKVLGMSGAFSAFQSRLSQINK